MRDGNTPLPRTRPDMPAVLPIRPGGGTSSDGRGATGVPTSESARSTVALTSEMLNGLLM